MELPRIQEKDDYAELEIEINSKKALPGDHIKGEVKLKVRKDIREATFKIEIIAQEACEIDKSNPQENDAKAVRDIIKRETIMAQNKKDLAAGGNYKEDYSFKIPDDAPASFESEMSGARGYIRYLVMATLEGKGISGLVVYKKIKVKEKVPVEEMMSKAEEGTVMGYCYANKGRLKLACKVESLATLTKVDHFIEGTVDIDNRGCPHKINRLNARISEHISMHAENRMREGDTEIVSWALAEIKGSEQKQEKFKVEIPYSERFKTLATSNKGHLLKRSYALTICPEYDTFTCCVPTIKIIFNVQNLKLHKKKDHKK